MCFLGDRGYCCWQILLGKNGAILLLGRKRFADKILYFGDVLHIGKSEIFWQRAFYVGKG